MFQISFHNQYNERDLSSFIYKLDSLIQNGTATDEQVLQRAMVGFEKGQTSYSLSLLHSISMGNGEFNIKAREELSKWMKGEDFDPDTIFITDTVSEDSFIRHIKIFTSDEIEIPFNPQYTEVTLVRAWADNNAVPGNMYYIDLMPVDEVTGGYSVFYFVPPSSGSYVHLKISGAFSGLIPSQGFPSDRNIFYEVFDSALGIFVQITDQQYFLKNLSKKAEELVASFDKEQNGFENFSKLYGFLKDNVNLKNIPLEISLFRVKSANEILADREATPFEIAVFLYSCLGETQNAKIFLVSPRISENGESFGVFPCFEDIFLVIDDSFWVDPTFKAPLGHLPGKCQNSWAYDVLNGELIKTPWFEPLRSSCAVGLFVEIEGNIVLYNLKINLTGDFLIALKNDGQIIERLISQIQSIDSKFSPDYLSMRDFSDSLTIQACFSGNLYDYEDGFSALYLFKPSPFLACFKPFFIGGYFLFPFPGQIIQKTEIKGDRKFLSVYPVVRQSPFSRADFEILNQNTLFSSAVRFWGERLPRGSFGVFEDFMRSASEDIFPEFLLMHGG
ncbi:hypothetical protein JXA84_04875 [candidate division WOR-3 bacterium]|nr:hypothetical protein [candidate division WOR-3 bacterium]